MPPVEHTSSPHQEVHLRTSQSDLKVVEKAMEIPVVHDTLEELERVKNNISENSTVKSARHMVEEGIKMLSENSTVQDGMKMFENPKIQQTMTSVKDTLGPTMTSVKETLNPWVATAVGQLDSMACGGIDSLTSALPALNNPTPELVESTKETARTYFSLASEYIASFTAAQLSLRLADKTLSFAEKSASFFKPDIKDDGLACTAYSKIRETRRTLRALRRAGMRRCSRERDETGMISRLTNLLSVNNFLRAVGLELAPSKSIRREDGAEAGEYEAHTSLKDLKGNLSGYKSEDDADYAPESSEDSLDETDLDEENSEEETGMNESANDPGSEEVGKKVEQQPQHEGHQGSW